jgi:hypothetical protein
MAYRWLTDLDQVFLNADIPYTEVGPSPIDPTGASSWRDRGRPPSTGQWDPAGVLCHHTASPAGTSDQSDLNVILCGNSQAPGPISQLYVGRSGTLYLVAAGRANHGGKGRRPGIDTGGCADMNALLLGIEAGNNGTGERWPDVQIDMYGAVVHALCDHYRWSVDSQVYLHATTGPPNGGCNSKIDPAGPWRDQPNLTSQTWDLGIWKSFVATAGGPGPQPPIPPPGGEEQVLTILQCTDAWAGFLGFTSKGVAQTVEWVDGDTAAYYKTLGCPVQNITVDQCSGMSLMGPLPQGDQLHEWTGREFRRVLVSTP